MARPACDLESICMRIVVAGRTILERNAFVFNDGFGSIEGQVAFGARDFLVGFVQTETRLPVVET